MADRASEESESRYRSLYRAAPVGIAVTDYSGRILEVNPVLCELMGVTASEAISSRAGDYYATPSDRVKFLRLVEGHHPVPFETFLKRKDGAVFPALLQASATELGGRRALLTIVQDLTAQKQNQERLQRLTSLLELFVARPNRNAYLRSVVNLLRTWCGCHGVGIRLVNREGRLEHAVSSGMGRNFLAPTAQTCWNINGCATMQKLVSLAPQSAEAHSTPPVSLVCHQPCELAKANGSQPRETRRSPISSGGTGSVAIIPIRSERGIIGSIHLSDRRSNRFGDEASLFLQTASTMVSEALRRFEAEEALRQSERRFRSLFEKHEAMMLLIDPRTGALVDANAAAAKFYRASRERLRSLSLPDLGLSLPGGNQGVALETTTQLPNRAKRVVEVFLSPIALGPSKLLYAILRDITDQRNLEQQVVEAAEQERQRIGRDLHDSLGGQLTGLTLLARGIAKRLERKDAEETTEVTELVQGLQEAIAITREFAYRFCPADPNPDGLVGSLRKLANDVRLRTGTDCRCQFRYEPEFQEAGVGAHLFRIAEEAVQNALRHARAKRISIRLRQAASGMELQIWNEGKPLPGGLKATQGLGLRSMRYRAAIIGARFELRAGRGGGTEICCRVPKSKLRKSKSK